MGSEMCIRDRLYNLILYFVNSHALRLCVVNVYIPAEELAPAEGVASSDTPCNKNRCINVTVILITILLLLLYNNFISIEFLI